MHTTNPFSSLHSSVPTIIVPFGPPGIGKGTFSKHCVAQFGWQHVSTGSLCRMKLKEDDAVARELLNVINEGKLVDDSLIFKIINPFLHKIIKENNALNTSYINEPHQHALDFVKKISQNQSILLLDGFPRNENQIMFLKNLIQECNAHVNSCFFVFLEAADDIVLDRLCSRIVCSNKVCEMPYNKNTISVNTCKQCNSDLIMRADDCSEIIKKRLELYRNSSEVLKNLLLKIGFSFADIDASLSEEAILLSFCQSFAQMCKIKGN